MALDIEFSTSPSGKMSDQTMKALSKRIHDDIDAYCVKAYGDQEHRKHLGASVIGHDCVAYSWYHYRWAKKEVFDGRQLRLFNRGHREEERFIEWFRGIGFKVWDVDQRTGKQWRITAAQGHFGGGLDSVAECFQYFGNDPVLLEFKTSGTGSKFTALKKNGVKIEKPRHYKQMCTYGKFYGMKYAVYACINKNDDDLHIEVVELDYELAHRVEVTATDIIMATSRLQRISETPAWHDCKICAFLEVCHFDKPMDKNCRSCKNCFAHYDGTFMCSLFGQIPDDFVKVGCNNWQQVGK